MRQGERAGQLSGTGQAGSQPGSSNALDRLGSTASSSSTVQLRSAGDSLCTPLRFLSVIVSILF